MRKRLKLKSYPLARCGTMCSETRREHIAANSNTASCVVISEKLHHLKDVEFAVAVRDAMRAKGFIFGRALA